MARPLPKWVMQKYAELWILFRDSAFHHSQTTEVLGENASIIIMHLRKNGWLEISLDQADARKRIYTLKSPEQAILDIANETSR